MASYFSENFKSSVRGALDNVHTSFARTISLYHEFVQNLDPLDINNNPLFGMPSTSTARLTPIKTQTDISGVIRYLGNQDDDILTFGVGANLDKSEGVIRIKVKEEYVDEVRKATQIGVDSSLYQLVSDQKVLGPWPDDSYTGNYSAFLLQRAD
tara:strand:- start:2498 stop:2959 length:462 start_codon:yes stop_codon:yes gene_type:complete